MTLTFMQHAVKRAAICGALIGSAAVGAAQDASFESPGLDQWVYHRLSGTQAGSWTDAALFTKRGISGSEEDRAAAYHAGYSLSGSIPAGLGASSYGIHSARLTLEVVEVVPAKDGEGNITQEVIYDPTYDSWKTHLLPSDDNYAADHVADSDPGRPICLFGFGLTNGYERLSFDPNGGQAATPPLYNEFTNPMVETAPPFSRNAFPLSFDNEGHVISVNNNVYEGVEANPWAVASITGKSAGEAIAAGDTLIFDLDVNDPNIQTYLQRSLDAGQLGLVVSALHQTSTDGFLRVATNKTPGKRGGRLDLTYTVGSRLSLHLEDQIPVLRFTGAAGQVFVIQRSRTLADWETVTDPTLAYPEDGLVEWRDSDSITEQKYYRVQLATP